MADPALHVGYLRNDCGPLFVREATQVRSRPPQVLHLPGLAAHRRLEPLGGPLEALGVGHQPGGAARGTASLGAGEDARAGADER